MFQTSQPTLFPVIHGESHQQIPSSNASIGPQRFPQYNLPADQSELLTGHKSSVWFDFPLSFAGRHTGKLSCNLQPVHALDICDKSVTRFWRLAKTTALWSLYHRDTSYPFEEISASIYQCETLEAFFRYLTEDLPGSYFNCQHASIFTLSVDSLNSRRLVLRKSSHPKLSRGIPLAANPKNLAFYTLDENALTTWVARTGRILRLQNLGSDATQLRQELDKYDKALQWQNKHQDSDNHVSFLAVPIRSSSQGSPWGCFASPSAHERIDGEYFTIFDERRLERIVNECVSPQLARLLQS